MGAAALSGQVTPVSGEPVGDSNLKLTFAEPAKEWSEAMPLGNGRLGAMVFGNVQHELVQLNEDTLWSGNPRDCTNPDALQHLPEVRRLVLQEHDYVKAGEVCKQMQGPFNQSYQPLADLHLEFGQPGTVAPAPATDYSRSLDLNTAVATVRYKQGDIRITREAFVSAVDQVIAVRVEASAPGSLKLTVSLTSLLHSETKADGASLILTGKAPANVVPNYWGGKEPVSYDEAEGKGMRFAAVLKLVAPGGRVEADGERLRVHGADSCVILIGAATGYRGFDVLPDLPASAILNTARTYVDSRLTKELGVAQKIAHQRSPSLIQPRRSATGFRRARYPHHAGTSGRYGRSCRPGAARALLPIRPLSNDCQFPSRQPARQLTGNLEQRSKTALEL